MDEKTLTLRDGKKMFYRVWTVDNPIATLHINHGMAEHSLRYDYFAREMNKLGYVVYAQDHRGHGYTIEGDEEGWFAEKDGWSIICDDSFELDQLIAREFPNVKHFIFGHSMGSFLTRCNLSRHSEVYDAAVICGTGASQGLAGKVGRSLARSRAKSHGSKAKAPIMDTLAFGSFSKKFKGEGKMSWLSSDKVEVEKYNNDPLCGFICSNMFYADLIEGSFTANDKLLIDKVRKDLPIFFISGELDPVGGYSKGVNKVVDLYRSAGIKDVRKKLYDKGRHEILNDIMRDEVISDVSAFYGEFVGE